MVHPHIVRCVAGFRATLALGAALVLAAQEKPAEAAAIASSVFAASANPAPVDHTLDLPNGGFLIHANPSPLAGPTGDGVDEQTTWSFDFTGDPHYAAFVAAGSLASARLTLTLNTAFFIGGVAPITDGTFPFDGITGVFPEWVVPSFLTRGPNDPIYVSGSITADLVKDVGESPAELFAWLTSHGGLFPMLYADDAIVTAATLVLSNDVPEPASLVLVGGGLLALAASRPMARGRPGVARRSV